MQDGSEYANPQFVKDWNQLDYDIAWTTYKELEKALDWYEHNIAYNEKGVKVNAWTGDPL